MELRAFYNKLLPETGVYCLFNKATKEHLWADGLTAFLELSENTITNGKGWYFATGSFSEEGTKFAGRTQDNVQNKRCFYLDIDAGPEKYSKQGNENKVYPTQRDALTALVSFIKATGFKPSMVVSSGAGLHVYYALNEDIDPRTEWRPAAVAFGKMAIAHGLLVDGQCTSDSARVLRPAGAIHESGEIVTVLSDNGPVYSFEDFVNTVRPFLARPKDRRDVNDDISSFPTVYSPSSAVKIAEHCGAMAEMRDTRGCMPEPEWRAMLGVIKHCVEGEELAHEWSSGHDAYDYEDTQQKLDRWETGPTTCERVEEYGCTHCRPCPHRGKITSPISLGRMTQLEQEDAGVEAPPAEVVRKSESGDEQLPENFIIEEGSGFGIDWKGSVPVLYGFKRVMKEDPETGEQVAVQVKVPIIKHNLFYLASWSAADAYNNVKVEYLLVYRHRAHQWREAPFDAQLTGGETASLLKYLAGLGINLVDHDPSTKKLVEKYVLMLVGATKLMRSRPVATKSFGFQFHDDGTPMYVHGGVTVMEDLAMVNTVVKKDLAQYIPSFRMPFTQHQADGDIWPEAIWDDVEASAQRFVDGFKQAYPNEKLGIYRLAVALGMCSPYLMFTNERPPNRFDKEIPAMGFVVSLFSQGSGTGKTKAQQIAALAIADYDKLMPSGGSKSSSGISNVGVCMMARTLGTLPLNIDEATGIAPEDVSDLIYRLSQGRDKARGSSDGSITAGATWSLVSTWSANTSMRDLLAQNRTSSPAEQLRLIELPFTNQEALDARPVRLDFETMFNDYFVANKGALGLMLARFALQHFDSMAKMARKAESIIEERLQLTTQERFYAKIGGAMLLMVNALRQMGINMFDAKELIAELKFCVESARMFITENNMVRGDSFREAMRSLAPSIAVTESMTDLRLNGATHDVIQNEHGLRMPLKGRLVKGAGVCYVSTRDLREWCAKEKVNYKTMMDEATVQGWIIKDGENTGKGDKINLAKGIPKLPPMQALCVKVNARLMDEHVMDPIHTAPNVVKMPVKHHAPEQEVRKEADNGTV